MEDKESSSRSPIELGTRIVTRVEVKSDLARANKPVGAVAEVVLLPTDHLHSYRVRFADGAEAMLRRREFGVLSESKIEVTRALDPLADHGLSGFVIFRCVVGSQAYGLAGPDSDVDRRGFYLPPADAHWSLAGVPEQLENDATQECYWELQKFLSLALKANPNVLECLWSPIVEMSTPIADEVVAIRHAFVSKLAYATFNGYALSQFKKIEQDQRNRGEIRWKHVMHLLRLLLSGTSLLETGELPVSVVEHRERLLDIKAGRIPWEEVDRWRIDLHSAFDRALVATRLPDRPDSKSVERLLLRARRSMVR